MYPVGDAVPRTSLASGFHVRLQRDPSSASPVTTRNVSRTPTALLQGLFETGNDDAWRGLCARCQPVMRAVAMRMGLRDADADDVVQTALLSFLEAYRRVGVNSWPKPTRLRPRLPEGWVRTVSGGTAPWQQRR